MLGRAFGLMHRVLFIVRLKLESRAWCSQFVSVMESNFYACESGTATHSLSGLIRPTRWRNSPKLLPLMRLSRVPLLVSTL
jgi:hypothetical protein